jgi:outer membrane protein TolC
LFEGGSRHFRLEQSHAEKRTATYQLNAAEQETWNSFQRGIGNIKSSLAQWETAKQTVELATESYRQLQELYTLGRATSLELFDAQDTLNDAKLDEITARYAIHTSYVSLLSELGLLEEYVSKGYIIATNSEDSSKGER